MSITLLIPGALRAECGGAGRLLLDPAGEPEAAVDLQTVLDELGRNWPRLHRRIRDEQGAFGASSTCTSTARTAGSWAGCPQR